MTGDRTEDRTEAPTNDPAAPTPDGSTTPPAGHGANGPRPLSASERSAAFATGRVPTGRGPVDRAAALRAGSVPVPRRFVLWLIIGFAVLGIGGIIAEKLIGNAGAGALISTPVTTLAGTGGLAPVTPTTPGAPPVHASPTAVIGLTRLTARQAPAVSLEEPDGRAWTLASVRGKVVVLTFLDAACDDICPVLSQEIDQADQQLGARSAGVAFVVVNSDPLETSLAPTPPVLTETGLAGHANVTFLNGSLGDLGGVWRRYGVTVAVNTTDRSITHTDVMDFVDPAGQLVLRASPFADESSLGTYTLQPGVIHTFATGVAQSAAGLLKGAS